MVTREQALSESYFHYGKCTRTIGPRGGVTEKVVLVRRSGQTQTWKTRPQAFRVPVKHGMYQHGEITHTNDHEFHTAKDCPLLLTQAAVL